MHAERRLPPPPNAPCLLLPSVPPSPPPPSVCACNEGDCPPLTPPLTHARSHHYRSSPPSPPTPHPLPSPRRTCSSASPSRAKIWAASWRRLHATAPPAEAIRRAALRAILPADHPPLRRRLRRMRSRKRRRRRRHKRRAGRRMPGRRSSPREQLTRRGRTESRQRIARSLISLWPRQGHEGAAPRPLASGLSVAPPGSIGYTQARCHQCNHQRPAASSSRGLRSNRGCLREPRAGSAADAAAAAPHGSRSAGESARAAASALRRGVGRDTAAAPPPNRSGRRETAE